MPPYEAPFNFADGALGDAEHPAKFSLRKLGQKYKHRILFGYFHHGVSLALNAVMSSLAISILRIVFWRSLKQMMGINTRRIIARVADKGVGFNWALGPLKGKSVGSVIFAFFTYAPVAVFIFHPGPFNASIGILDAIKRKSLPEGKTSWGGAARLIGLSFHTSHYTPSSLFREA